MTRKRPVGIREVAQHADVSVATVSYTLNKPDRVSEETRRRVLESMATLGFVRNDLARQLRSGSAQTIGMVVLNIANPFFASLVHACEVAAEERGFTIVIGSSDQSLQRENHYLDLFEKQRVRGVLVAAVDGPTDHMRALAARGVPVVLFDTNDSEHDFCSVALDGAAAGRMGVDHLAATGRRRIALVGGPYRQLADRWGAAVLAAQAEGVEVEIIDTDDQTIAQGSGIGDQIARRPADERPDAIFAGNDLLALGLMRALSERSDIDIPRDIAIMGVDDIDYAELSPVSLTTLAQPVDDLAQTALLLLNEHASDPLEHRHQQQLLAPRLIARRSTEHR